VLDPSLFHVGENLIAVEGFDKFGPFNNISVDMTINLVPEPGGALFGLTIVSAVLVRHRK